MTKTKPTPRTRVKPTPAELVDALAGAFGATGTEEAPKVKDRNIISFRKWMDYPMAMYVEGHHFGYSHKKYKNYTEAFDFKVEQITEPKKYSGLFRAMNTIKRLHKNNGTLSNIQEELMAIETMLREKGKNFDVNPSIAALLEYGEDLTDRALKGELDECIGREKEIDKLILSLAKRKKANPILTGKAGVGKTQLVQGLANRIAQNNAGWLNGWSVVELSTTGLVAGTKMVGSLQEKMLKVIEAIKGCDKLIVFIDEIHTVMSGGKGMAMGEGVGDILKPHLADGSMKLIGATTLEEFKIITKDEAMARRFINLEVEEVSVAVSDEIILASADTYATYHGVDYHNESLALISTLAKRYAGKNKYLPDSGFDLLDLAGANAKNEGVMDVDVAYLLKIAGKLYNEEPADLITTELSKRELKTTIGYV